MSANHVRIALFTLSAAIAAPGCHSEPAAVEDCHQAAGDQTCADLFGDERPFCVAPQAGCELADQFQGCVASQPTDECYSPCGDGTVVSEDASCLGAAEDDTSSEGTSTETGGENGDGDGDGDQPPACGNGVVEAGEPCDDGNTIDHDQCSNSCTLPACGDGIVQEWNGETCDDGNTLSGDACAATCVLPGTVIWSRLVEGDSCREAAVALADNGNIHVVSDCSNAGRGLTVFDPNGDVRWTITTPLTTYGAPNLALSMDSGTVMGGQIGSQAQVRQYDSSGSLLWSAIVPLASSAFYGTSTDGSGTISAVGTASNTGILSHYHEDGQLDWSQSDLGPAGDVASNPVGSIWVLGSQSVRHYTAEGDPVWTSANLAGDYQKQLAVDNGDCTYVLGQANGSRGFVVTKLDNLGDVEWLQLHDEPAIGESGNAIAVLPAGGVLIAGTTNDDGSNAERDGLLSWYAEDGTLLLDAAFDGAHNNDPDLLHDVAVSPDGYAVAVGDHQLSNNGPRLLWLLKVAI